MVTRMKTTLDLPDELLVAAKAAAVRRRTTLKAMVEHALRRELSYGEGRLETGEGTRVYEVDESGLPYFKSRGGRVTSEKVYELMEEEES
jgi:hypothetical protein